MTIFTKCRQVTNYFTVSFSSEQIGKHNDNDKLKIGLVPFELEVSHNDYRKT